MSTSIEPGAVIDGKYRVLRRIGEGGMGTVYEGENVRIERRVAIKVLHAHVASSPEFASRFEREARASARIGSPHVCDVLDLGDLPSGDRFLVMEFLEGESFEDRIATRLLDPRELAPIAFEVLEGLGAMHQAGVIHRDLKPANVFLAKRAGSRPETVKILDFGVAKLVPRGDEPGAMTATGMMMGTPLYMSPEQARGARDVDGRTDVYAASVMFYRALTGALPHTSENLHELLFKIVLEDARPILELAPGTDPEFAAIVMRGLARDPDARWPTARAYQEALAAWGEAQGIASLRFVVTLPNEPPPLRNISGGFPSARIAAASVPGTGPQPRPVEAPNTPAFARTLPVGETPMPEARSVKLAATPTAWADDGPEGGLRPRSASDAKGLAASGAPPPLPSSPPRGRSRTLLLAALGLVVVGGGAMGVKSFQKSSGASGAPTTSVSAGTTALGAEAVEAGVASAPAAATSGSIPSLSASSSAADAAERKGTTPPSTIAPGRPLVTARPGAIVQPTASAPPATAPTTSAPTVTTTPGAIPSATSTARKFRTDLN